MLGQDEGSWEASCQIKSAWRKRLWDLTHPWESQRLVRCRRRTKQAIDKHVERYVVPFSGWEDGGSPVPRWWEPPPAPTRVVLLPPRHPCVMEVEQVLGFSGGVCFPLVCTPLHLASACVWQIHHRLCGFVIVIRSLVFVA